MGGPDSMLTAYNGSVVSNDKSWINHEEQAEAGPQGGTKGGARIAFKGTGTPLFSTAKSLTWKQLSVSKWGDGGGLSQYRTMKTRLAAALRGIPEGEMASGSHRPSSNPTTAP